MTAPRPTILACALAALPFAATAESLYYDVPVTVYNYVDKEVARGGVLSDLNANQPVKNTLATTITGQLLSISGEHTTPALQLIVDADRDTANFRLYRQDMPPEANVVFPQSGYLDLVPDFGMIGFASEARVSILFNLLTPAGKPWGKQYYFRDAANKPLTNYPAVALQRASSSTSQSVTLDADGGFLSQSKIIMKNGNTNVNPAYSHFEITDAQTGVRNLNIFYTRNNDDSASTTTVPFLLDWNTSHPDVAIYSGRFVTADGKPAGPTRFNMGYESSLLLDSTGNRLDYTTSADGSFRIARNIKSPLSFPGFSLGNDARHPTRSMIFFHETGKRHSRIIDPDTPLTITLRESTTVTVTLLDENGKPIQEPPSLPGPDNPFNGGFAILEINDNRSLYNTSVILPDTQPGTYKPIALAVPGRYMAHAPGYIYAPQDVTASTREVVFKPLLADFTLTGRVETPSGEPVKDALVIVDGGFSRLPSIHGLSENPYTTLNDFMTETQGDFQKAKCYLTRTDANGQYTISGNSLGRGARLLVATQDNVLKEIYPFEFTRYELPSAENRLSGSHALPTVVLAREAHVTFTLPSEDSYGSKGPKENSQMPPRVGLLQGDDATTSPAKLDLGFSVINSTWAQQIKPLAENQWSVNVPSETTFTLNVAPNHIFTRYHAIVSEPLKPDESRDITDLLTPVPPDSEKYRVTNTGPVTPPTVD